MRNDWITLRLAVRLIPMIGLAVLLLHQRRRERKRPGEEVPDYIKYGSPRQSFGAIELPMTMLYLPLAFALWCGVKNGLEALVFFSAGLVALLSVYDLLLLCLLPWLRKHISARTCAMLWLLPSLLYYAAYYLEEAIPQMPRFVIYVPPTLWRVIGLVWFTGFVAILVWYFRQHHRFVRELQDGEQKPDEKVLQIWTELLTEYDFPEETAIPLRIQPEIDTPLAVGISTKKLRVYLPDRAYTEEELRLIFRHELCHVTRGDSGTKLFWCFCRALCWFNPLIWIAAKKALNDLELACDEAVLAGADEPVRRRYASLLLDAAGDARGFSTCLSSGAQTLRHRLKSVVSPRKVRTGTAVLVLAMILLCLCQGQIAFATKKGTLGSYVDIGTVILAADNEAATQWLRELQVLDMPALNKMNSIDGYAADWLGSLSFKDAQGRSGTVFFNEHWVSVTRVGAGGWNSLSETYRLAQPLDTQYLQP